MLASSARMRAREDDGLSGTMKLETLSSTMPVSFMGPFESMI